MRICTSCGENKPNNQFFSRKSKPSSHCKSCELVRINEWRNNNKDKQAIIDRRSRLKNTYGISLEQYEELLLKQKECCAVCHRHQSLFPKRLSVDHNHKTGEVRGLLCTYCNHKVVGRHTDGDLLRKLADYVEQGTGWFVPKKNSHRRKTRLRKSK